MTTTAGNDSSSIFLSAGREPGRWLPLGPTGRRPRAAGRRRTRQDNSIAGETCPQFSPPGAIGAAVIRTARQSARLTRRGLARRLAVGAGTVHAWEDGSVPLFCTDYGRLRQLAAALSPSDSEPRILRRLMLASQCDLLITGMLRGFEDYAEVPPIDEDTSDGELARNLLLWALAGVTPPWWSARSPAPPLLAEVDVMRITALAADLDENLQDSHLATFGQALAALASLIPPAR